MIFGEVAPRAWQNGTDYYYFNLNQFGCVQSKMRLRVPKPNVLLSMLRMKDMIKLDATQNTLLAPLRESWSWYYRSLGLAGLMMLKSKNC
jgi:hypothetical protein